MMNRTESKGDDADGTAHIVQKNPNIAIIDDALAQIRGKNGEPPKKRGKKIVDDNFIEWKGSLNNKYLGAGIQTAEIVLLVEKMDNNSNALSPEEKDEHGNIISQDVLIEKCMKYIRPGSAAMENQDIDETYFDIEGAKERLQNDGRIDNIHKFCRGDIKEYGKWYVSSQLKVALSKKDVIGKMENLFNGGLCLFQDGYNNYDQTPLTPHGSSPKGKKMQPVLLQKIEKRVFTILESWKDDTYSVTNSIWEGCSIREQENGINYNNRFADRETYFNFWNAKKSEKFMLKFKWNHEVGFVSSDR